MTTEPREKRNPFKKELSLLESKDEKNLLEAIKALRESGNSETTSKVISLLNKDVSDQVKSEVINYLYDLKSQVALEPIFDAIHDENLRDHRHVLISSLWQSSIDGSSRMIELMELTSNSDYMESLEILTVLENFEGPFNEDEVFEAIAILNEVNDSRDDDEIKPLIENMLTILNQI